MTGLYILICNFTLDELPCKLTGLRESISEKQGAKSRNNCIIAILKQTKNSTSPCPTNIQLCSLCSVLKSNTEVRLRIAKICKSESKDLDDFVPSKKPKMLKNQILHMRETCLGNFVERELRKAVNLTHYQAYRCVDCSYPKGSPRELRVGRGRAQKNAILAQLLQSAEISPTLW